MTKFKHSITKSRSGHYTMTLRKEFMSAEGKPYWNVVSKVEKLSSLSHARGELSEAKSNHADPSQA